MAAFQSNSHNSAGVVKGYTEHAEHFLYIWKLEVNKSSQREAWTVWRFLSWDRGRQHGQFIQPGYLACRVLVLRAKCMLTRPADWTADCFSQSKVSLLMQIYLTDHAMYNLKSITSRLVISLSSEKKQQTNLCWTCYGVGYHKKSYFCKKSKRWEAIK